MADEPILHADNLVLYKQRAARVINAGDKKVDIQTDSGQVSVRPKDVTLLHAGPLRTLGELKPVKGEVMAAWELLAGETVTLAELVELAFDEDSAAATWTAWELVDEGLYFSGSDPAEILVHTAETVDEIKAGREAKIERERAWQALLSRLHTNTYLPEDTEALGDVVSLALEQRDQSRIMRALVREETPQSAHKLLLDIGFWEATTNPYPQRLGAATTQPDLTLPDLPDEERRDLTHLVALAIDDEGSTDPDDALSWDDGRLWVHIADVGALVAPDSLADREARARGANLYLPEGTIHMLPGDATDLLGLGLQEKSPALSFCIRLNDDATLADVEITPSWVQVTRLTYEDADERLDEPVFAELYAVARRYGMRRMQNGSIEMDLPEVKMRVLRSEVGVEIQIKPLPSLRSRDLVREAMLITGEAVTRYAEEHDLAIPYSTQDADQEVYEIHGGELSDMFAMRRFMKPSQYKSSPGRHTGLGMDSYAQATSPLRRYTDLLVHQQLRAHLAGGEPMEQQTLMAHMAEASTSMRSVRTAERLSNKHWKLVYLQQTLDAGKPWQGEGIVVYRSGSRAQVLIPDLDLETDIYGQGDLDLDTSLHLTITAVDLPQLETRWQVRK